MSYSLPQQFFKLKNLFCASTNTHVYVPRINTYRIFCPHDSSCWRTHSVQIHIRIYKYFALSIPERIFALKNPFWEHGLCVYLNAYDAYTLSICHSVYASSITYLYVISRVLRMGYRYRSICQYLYPILRTRFMCIFKCMWCIYTMTYVYLNACDAYTLWHIDTDT